MFVVKPAESIITEHALSTFAKSFIKSKTTSDNAKVTESLKSMVVGRQRRSLVEKVYVTVSCNSKTPVNKRDLRKNDIIEELSDVAGDAQGIQYLI